MLTRTRESQIEKAKRTMREIIKYAQEVAEDERLRSDLTAAFSHGSKAGDRLKKDVTTNGIYARLARDEKLRKHVRAMLDDLDSASDRIRRKQSHRLRNAALMAAGAAAAAVAIPKVRSLMRTEPDVAI